MFELKPIMHLLNSSGLKAGAIDFCGLWALAQYLNPGFYFTLPIHLFKNGTVNISSTPIMPEAILIFKMISA